MVPFVTKISTTLEDIYFIHNYMLCCHTKYNMSITHPFSSPQHLNCTKKGAKCAGNLKMDASLADLINTAGHRPLFHPGHVLLTFWFQG
jgi:hypothetical protein